MATDAIISAVNGNKGNIGTLKGRSIVGSFFRKAKKENMETMYKLSAPKQAIVIISPVAPVNRATIPIKVFANNAFAGVLNLGWTLPKKSGA